MIKHLTYLFLVFTFLLSCTDKNEEKLSTFHNNVFYKEFRKAIDDKNQKLGIQILNEYKAKFFELDYKKAKGYYNYYEFYCKINFDFEKIPYTFLSKEIKKAKQNKHFELLYLLLHTRALKYQIDEKYLKSFKEFNNIKKILIEHKEKDFLDQSYFYYSYAYLLFKFQDYKSVIKYAKIALNHKQSCSLNIILLNDLIGRSYMSLNENEKAIKYFSLCIKESKYTHIDKNIWVGISKGNISECLFNLNKLVQSENQINQAISICKKGKILDNLSRFYYIKALILSKTDNQKEFKKILHLAKINYKYCEDLSLLIKLKEFDLMLYKSQKNQTDYISTLNDLYKLKFLFSKKFDYSIKLKADYKMLLLTKENADLIYKNEIQYQKNRRNFIFLILFFIMTLFFIVYRVRVYKTRLKEDEYKNKEKLNIEKLQFFSNLLIQKNDQIDKLKTAIESRSSAEEIEKLKSMIILTDDDWNQFQVLFKKVYPDFLINLKNQFPHLTPAEVRYVVLCKLNLDNKQMASILGVGTDAIRSIRSRLFKKIDSNQFEKFNLFMG